MSVKLTSKVFGQHLGYDEKGHLPLGLATVTAEPPCGTQYVFKFSRSDQGETATAMIAQAMVGWWVRCSFDITCLAFPAVMARPLD